MWRLGRGAREEDVEHDAREREERDARCAADEEEAGAGPEEGGGSQREGGDVAGAELRRCELCGRFC